MAHTRLAHHQLIATTDIDQARDAVARRFCPHFLGLTRRGGHLDMVHNGVPLGPDVTVNYMRYGDEVRITPGCFENFYLLQIPLAGHAQVKVGQRTLHSNRSYGSLGSPTEPVDMVWSRDCEQLLVYFRRGAVEQLAGVTASTRSGPLTFDPLVDLSARSIRAWLKLVYLAVEDIEIGGGLLAAPLAAAHFEQTLLSGLLALQPNSAAPARHPGQRCGSRAVRRALELIESSPDTPWQLADLASRAGVSVRTLQDHFRTELGVSPLTQLRHVRLERTRRELLAAEPGAASVTEVATRWGFTHLGRFSEAYRASFHELPSETLAR